MTSRTRFRCPAALLLLAVGLADPLPAQSPTLLRLRNAASVDRLVADSAGGMVATGTLSQGAIPATGAGTRLVWYPGKAAFRVGNVDGAQWDNASVGNYSVALGRNTTASGLNSTALGFGTTASGGYSSVIGSGNTASGFASTALGANSTASGPQSIAVGWATTASGSNAMALGYETVASGGQSTAMGAYASTNGQQGAFVYGDYSTSLELSASATNQFSVRAAGGVRFFTNAAMTLGAQLQANQTSWSALSDRNRKSRILAVDGEEVLSRIRRLPVSTWIYTDQPDASVRHIGPMAQDWRAAFGFSADSTTINSGDFDGVNLAGIQALDRRDEQQQAALRELRERVLVVEHENAALRARLERIEQMLASPARRP